MRHESATLRFWLQVMAHILSPNDLMLSGQSGYFAQQKSLQFHGNLICTLGNNVSGQLSGEA